MAKNVRYHIEVSADGENWGGLRELAPRTLMEAQDRRHDLLKTRQHVRIIKTTVEVLK